MAQVEGGGGGDVGDCGRTERIDELADRRIVRTASLPDGRGLTIRRAVADDVSAVADLYSRLSPSDLNRRFFTARPPNDEVVRQWVSPERKGIALVLEVHCDDGPPTVIGEAGYALLPDGDGELAITVDPDFRGGLGAWLLDALVETAADEGIPNLHADILLLNRPMVSLMRHRGSATVDHPDLGQVRLVIGTTARTPGWAPTRTRPRLLVEGVRGMWWGENLARNAGFDVRMCGGPGGVAEHCPVLRGEGCPLVDGADVIVSELPDGEVTDAIHDAHRCAHPGLTLVVAGDDFDVASRGPELIGELRERV